MTRNYPDYEETSTLKVCEPAVVVAYQTPQDVANVSVFAELSVKEKKTFLNQNLHPSTVAFLKNVNWMENAPFPMTDSQDDVSWIDDAEETGDSDIVSQDIIDCDRKAWQNLK